MFSWATIPKVWEPLLLVALPILILSLLTWAVFAAASAGRLRATIENLLIIFCFSTLGATVGILAASSDSSAVAPLLPAVLSLVGGVVTYLVSRQSGEGAIPADRLIIAASITALSLTLFTGALIGAEMRSQADAYRESAEYRKYQVDVEREVEAYKRSLALRDSASGGKVEEVFAELARRKLAQ